MTAHVVGSLSSHPGASKGASAGAAPARTDAAPFEQHLHDARVRGGPAAGTRDAQPQRGPDPARDRRDDPSPAGPHTRRPDTAGARLDKPGAEASTSGDAAPEPPAAPTVKPPAATEATPLADVIAGAASDEPATTEEGAKDGETGAAALVGAMLTMLGPAAAKPSLPGAAVAAAAAGLAGKPVTADANAATLLQIGSGATTAAAASAAVATVSTPLLVTDGLEPDPKSSHDAARVDAAPLLASPAPAAPAATAVAPLPVASGAHAFAQELGQQIAWSVGHDVKQARIRLHPEELGSLDLKISVNHNRVDLVFHAQHPGAVNAVQQSLPQLDQMLAQHGLSLGNAEVGQHDRGDQDGQAGRGEGRAETADVQAVSLVTPLSQVGLLDAFA